MRVQSRLSISTSSAGNGQRKLLLLASDTLMLVFVVVGGSGQQRVFETFASGFRKMDERKTARSSFFEFLGISLREHATMREPLHRYACASEIRRYVWRF